MIRLTKSAALALAIVFCMQPGAAAESCTSTCTAFDIDDYRCNAGCDGVNNCAYNSSVVSERFGLDMKTLCEGNRPGWTVPHNATHEIRCCNGGYVRKLSHVQAFIQVSQSVLNVQTYFAGIVIYEPTGEPYSVYVVIYDSE